MRGSEFAPGVCLALVVAGAAASTGCGEEVRAAEAKALHAGTRALPASGVVLRASPGGAIRPVVFVHDLEDRLPQSPGIVELAPDERVVVSGDRRHAVRMRHDGARTRFTPDGETPFDRQGEIDVVLDRSGGMLLALPRRASASGPAHVEVMSRRGDTLAQIAVAEVRWGALASNGERLVLATDADVRVLALNGTELASFGPAARGALSDDGTWLALERGNELLLHRVGPGFDPQAAPWIGPVGAPSLALAHTARARLLRVAPDRLQVVDYASGAPQTVVDRRPPPGATWRDALEEDDGTILAGRIEVVRHARRERTAGGGRFVPGLAHVGVEELVLDPASQRETTWDVPLWNADSPVLASSGGEQRYALVWPSVYEVRFP